ncbi:ribosome-associated translation inhibitor RaiA [Granulicella sp. dw_53]|uniref:ribosome hibernation-promoting factor, HPF/YfiA family n=1 Tax=Granulicella sp. dw_53 TaxID=2719792 RepID=UPI001BD5E362|nr:ribosome-associated translation inhibitor RaiA [Granulicella sp. dw_53]
MEIEYTGRQTTITKKLKTMADAGLDRVAKIVGSACSVHVILTTEKYRQSAEITLKTRTDKLVVKCEGTEMVVVLHDALSKIEQQAIRHKQKTTTIKRHSKAGAKGPKGTLEEVVEPVETVKVSLKKAAAKSSIGRKAVPMLVHSFPSRSPLPEPHVVRSSDSVALRPMSLEEAVKEAAFRDRDVFVFRDHLGQAMVLHRKRDGKMELIEIP